MPGHSDDIYRVQLFEYAIPMAHPVQMSKTVVETRQLLLLNFLLPETQRWIEVSPLPGFSRETIQTCIAQLQAIFARKPSLSIGELLRAIKASSTDLCSSVSYSLSQLAEPAIGLEVDVDVSIKSWPRVKICPLVLNEDKIPNAPVVKMKVGRDTLRNDIERINTVLAGSEFTGQLRLDANQQWAQEDIETLCKAVDCTRIQWLEDPIANTDAYKNWPSYSAIPLALDESLYQQPNPHSNFPIVGLPVRALILKPTILGQGRFWHYVHEAKKYNVQTVISSSFEGPVGMTSLHDLANKLSPEEYHGLDTLKYFAMDYQQKLNSINMTLLEQWQWP